MDATLVCGGAHRFVPLVDLKYYPPVCTSTNGLRAVYAIS